MDAVGGWSRLACDIAVSVYANGSQLDVSRGGRTLVCSMNGDSRPRAEDH
jgi:hypothetical protein